MFTLLSSRRNRRRRVPQNWTILPLESRVLLSAIQVTSQLRNDGSVNLKFDGTADDDAIFIGPDGGGQVQISTGNPDGFSLNQGAPLPLLTFAALHDLKFNFGTGNDALFLSDVSANDVKITDGASATDISFFVVQNFLAPMSLGDVRIDVGEGVLLSNMDVLNALSLDSFSVNCADTVLTSISMNAFGPGTITMEGEYRISSLGASSTDFVALHSGPANRIQIGDGVKVKLGGGVDSVHFTGSISIDGETDIDTGSGNDQIVFITGDAESFTLDGKVRIETGQGADLIRLVTQGSLSRIVSEDHVSISTGDQNDTVELRGLAVGKNLTVDTGASDSIPSAVYPYRVLDFVSLGNTEIFGQSVVQSKGLTNVSVFAQNSLLQPARFHGLAIFTLGSGSVDASYVPDPSSYVIFDGLQKYTGLNQQITVSYGNNVVFQANKRKLFNAILI